MAKKAKKAAKKKSLKLRKKALRDLPAKKTSKVKGGSVLTDSLTPSQRAELQGKLDAGQKVIDASTPKAAPPYIPVVPKTQLPRL